jgi:hypothetical protein
MHRKWNWQAISGWAALFGLFAIVVGYYVTHKPVSQTIAINLALLIWRLLVGGMIISIGGGLGRRLLPEIPLHPLAALSIHAGLGLGLISLGILAVGFANGLYSWLSLLTMLLLAIFLRHEIYDWWKDWQNLWTVFRSSGKGGKTIAVLILFILVITLVDSMAPPIRFDALVYHLTLPQHYLDAHRYIYTPNNIFWGMPQITEMLYTWAMSLGDYSGALVLGWMAGLIALIGVLGMLVEMFGKDAAWVAVAALVDGYTLASGLAWGYTEWWVILFSVGFLIMMWSWGESGRNAYLGLSGVFAGLALGSKYTAGILIICGAVVISLRFKSNILQLCKAWFWFGASALMVFSPWLVKNYWATGNPFYPLVFPSGEMSPLRLSLLLGGEAWGNWLDVVLLPFRATILGVEGAPGYSVSIGPLLLGLGLAAGLGWRMRAISERAMTHLVFAIGLTGIIIWMVVGRFSSYGLQARLYFPIFSALAVLAGAGYLGFSRITLNGIRFGRITGFLVVMVLGFNTLQVGLDTIGRGTLEAIFGLHPPQTYLADNLGWFEPAMSSIRELPEESRVLMLWESRSLYCLPLCEPDEIIDRWLRERYIDWAMKPKTPSEILQSWRMNGYTHLLFHKLGADFIRQNDRKNYNHEDWLALEMTLDLLKPVESFGDAYILYRLIP